MKIRIGSTLKLMKATEYSDFEAGQVVAVTDINKSGNKFWLVEWNEGVPVPEATRIEWQAAHDATMRGEFAFAPGEPVPAKELVGCTLVSF